MNTAGYVYVLSNPCIRDPEDPKNPLVKIGSAVDYDSRMGTLNSAVPYDFIIEMSVLSEDCRGLETYIHNHEMLKRHRIFGSEFFKVDVKDAKERVRQIAFEYCKNNKLPRPKVEVKIVQLGRAAATVRRNRDALLNGKLRFVCTRLGQKAFGHFDRKDAFVVEKGSFISPECAKQFEVSRPFSYYARWKAIVAEGLDETGCLKQDEYFSSRAFAASVVCGGIRNGNNEWVQEDDEEITLGMYFGK